MENTTTLQAIGYCVAAGVPSIAWGDPGTGKTSAITALAEAMGAHLEVIIASICEPADIGGWPVADHTAGCVRRSPPLWARNMIEHGGGIAFWDEASTPPPAVQAGMLRVILDNVVGDVRLPDNTVHIAAANPPESAAGGWDLAPPLANRFCHFDWTFDAKTWSEGLAAGAWPAPTVPTLPAGWESNGIEARGLIAGYTKTRPQVVLQLPQDETKAGRAWPSPRSWTMASRLLSASMAGSAPHDVRMSLVAGCVGIGVAHEFFGWVEKLDLPDPEEILKKPTTIRLPFSRGDRMYVVLAGVAHAAQREMKDAKERIARNSAAWQVLKRAHDEGKGDIAAGAARALAKNHPKGAPVPKEAKAFLPMLKAAGLIPGGK